MLLKLAGLILTGAAVIGTTVALPIALTNSFNDTVKIKNFFDTFNDQYKELNMFADSLDYAYNYQFDFKSKANTINSSMKTFIRNLAKSSVFKDNINKKPTVLFVKNDHLVFRNDENSKIEANQFWCEQPMLFPQIYASTQDQETPGLNFYFPAPINNDANSLFDDWFEIGAASFDSAYNKYSISQRLVTSWTNTCDFVFYLYDSNNIQDEKAFVNYVWNTTDSSLWPYKMLKQDAICKRVIPLDMEWFYFGIWDQVGTFIMLYLISNIISNPENCININLNNWDQVQWNNEINRIAKNLSWTPKKNKLVALPKPINASNSNYLATLYNLVGHSFSLGILPNYIMKFNENNTNKKYNNLAGYLSWFQDSYSFNFVTQNDLSTVSSIKALKLYCISANRDILGSNAVWPIPSANQPSLLHDTTPTEIGNIISELNIKCAFSERNDTAYTQSSDEEKIVYDTVNKQEYTVNEWVESHA